MSSVTTKVGIELEVRMGKAEAEIKKLNAELEKARRNAGATADSLSGKGKGLSAGLEAIAGKAGLAAAAVLSVGAAFDTVSQKSLKFQAVQSQLTVGIGQARDATQGLVTDFDLMRASNEAVRDGLVKNEEEFAKMAGLAVRLGVSVGKDAAESVDLLSNALDKLSARSLDALGLAVDNEQAFFKYASSIGKTVDQLSEAEQKQAMWNAVLEDGEAKLGSTKLAVDESALAIQQFKTSLINWVDEAAVTFTGTLASMSEQLGGFLENVADFNAEYGLDGRGGVDKLYFKRVKTRGMGGIAGPQGEASRAEHARIAASRESLAVMEKSNQEMRLSMSMLDANAKANEIVTKSLDKQNKSRKQKIDLFKAERAEFQRQMGQVEMGRAGSSLGQAMDRDAFSAQLSEAQMAKAGQDARRAQVNFEEAEHEKAVQRKDEMFAAIEREQEAIRRAEEEKRLAMEATMRVQMQLADITREFASQSVQLAGVVADGAIKSGKRREAVQKGFAGSELIVIGIVESVKAIAAFAGQNYVEGAMHIVASATAFAKGGQLLAQAGRGGGGGGGGGSAFAAGSAFGGGAGTGSGSVESSSGGSSRPTSNGPISEREESVQRSGRGASRAPTRNGESANNGPNINLFHLGSIDQTSVTKLRQALKANERKSGKVTS